MDDERRGAAAASLLAVLALALSLVVVVAASSSVDVSPEALSPAGEAEALVAIKAALHDKSNVLGDWKAGSGGAGGPCHWSLVFCSDDGHVNGLEMVHQNLSGALSPAIGKLRRLQFLLLQHNDISGPIPETLGRLKLLQRLDLAFNQFTGTIPGTLGHPRDIFFVRLSHNNLSGSIPDSLATSQSVYLLDLSYNNLSGPVPNFIVKNVYFAGNPLLHNLSCEGQSCSYVVQEPVDIPSAKEEPVVITEHPSTHNKNGLSGTARLVSLYIAAALLIAFLIAGIIAVVWQWRSRHQIFADLDGNDISSAVYAWELFYSIHLQRG